MRKEIIYWTTKDGIKIDIDEMDINHLRNTLKMIVRNIEIDELEIEMYASEIDLF
jgi:hypothetical protein